MSTIRAMIGYIRKHPFLWAASLFMPSFAALATNLAFAYGMQAFTAQFDQPGASMQNIAVIMLGTLLILVVTTLIEDAARYGMAVFIVKTENSMRQNMTKALLLAHYVKIGALDRGELSTRYLTDTGRAALLVSWDLHGVLWPIVLGSGYLVALFNADSIIAAIMLLLVAIVIVLNLFFVKRFAALEKKSLAAQDGYAGIISSVVRGKMSVRLLGAGQAMASKACEQSYRLFQVEEEKTKLSTTRAASMEFFAAVLTSLTAPLACALAAYGLLSLAAVVMIAQLCRYLILYTRNFGVALTNFRAHAASYERLREIQSLEREPDCEMEMRAPSPSANVLLHCKDVAVSYGESAVLSGFCLTVRKGEIVALRGPSGGGKSSIVKALLRLIEHEGRIELLGRDINALSPIALRQSVAYVPERSEVFGATVEENMRYAAADADISALRKALNASALFDADILGRDAGARGEGLSGGQRQRVAIARALLRDAPLIVMDEPTAALDAQSEAHVLRTIEALKAQGKGILIITHRESTARIADSVVTLP